MSNHFIVSRTLGQESEK